MKMFCLPLGVPTFRAGWTVVTIIWCCWDWETVTCCTCWMPVCCGETIVEAVVTSEFLCLLPVPLRSLTSPLLIAFCKRICRCCSAVNRHLSHKQALYGQYCLWPRRIIFRPWFLQRTQFDSFLLDSDKPFWSAIILNAKNNRTAVMNPFTRTFLLLYFCLHFFSSLDNKQLSFYKNIIFFLFEQCTSKKNKIESKERIIGDS